MNSIIIVVQKDNLDKMKEVFKSIKNEEGVRLKNNYCSVPCNKIITNVQNQYHRVFNEIQEENFKIGHKRCIYSFLI